MKNADGPRVCIIHPSRGRPTMALQAAAQHIRNCTDKTKIKYIFSLDTDDPKQYAKALYSPNVEFGFMFGKNSGCCQAVNRCYNRGLLDWADFFILTSDDMELCKGWDQEFIRIFEERGYDKVIKTKQPRGTDDYLTLQIGGHDFFRQYGCFFYPDYTSMFGDRDMTEYAKKRGLWVDAPELICPHNHPWTNGKNPLDETYLRENKPEKFKAGEAIFTRRASEGFPGCFMPEFHQTVYPVQYGQDNLQEALGRLRHSMNSLAGSTDFIVIDGGNRDTGKTIAGMVGDRSLLYLYKPCAVPGSKGLLLNYAVKNWVTAEYFFQSDVDIIYPPGYLSMMKSKAEGPGRVLPFNTYCRPGVPGKTWIDIHRDGNKMGNHLPQSAEGLGLLHLPSFMRIRGYDEEIVGWGQEDVQLNYRLEQLGNTLLVLSEVMTYHQYHENNFPRRAENLARVAAYKKAFEDLKVKTKDPGSMVNALTINPESWGIIPNQVPVRDGAPDSLQDAIDTIGLAQVNQEAVELPKQPNKPAVGHVKTLPMPERILTLWKVIRLVIKNTGVSLEDARAAWESASVETGGAAGDVLERRLWILVRFLEQDLAESESGGK